MITVISRVHTAVRMHDGTVLAGASADGPGVTEGVDAEAFREWLAVTALSDFISEAPGDAEPTVSDPPPAPAPAAPSST